LLERPLSGVEAPHVVNNEIVLRVRPFQIVTLRLSRRSGAERRA